MKIVEPSVKLINFSDRIQQIGYAASICYASNKQGSVEWLDNLWKSGHKSVFRHGTRYYIIPSYYYNQSIIDSWRFNPYCGFYYSQETKLIFLSINEQYYIEHPYMKDFIACEVNELNFIHEAKKIDDYDYNRALHLIRLTFEIVTQISTSRELNRVSPNNICEQSTRYCNFSKDKFGNEITICQPHWFDILHGKDEIHITKSDKVENYPIEIFDDKYLINDFIVKYFTNLKNCENDYIECVNNGIAPQDARGLLPLDTATKCIYTYRIEEWEHFLDLRFRGLTGKPHPNAKIIASKINDIIFEYLKV